MNNAPNKRVLIVGVGGLGTHMVHEALERGAQVSVLVRNPAKLEASIDVETLGRLHKIFVGDATDPAALDGAMQDIDVVLSGNGAHKRMASEMAQAVHRNHVDKLCWPAGGTNLMSEDGLTPAYLAHAGAGFNAEAIYKAHQACIDAIRETGINYVILCPGRMTSAGYRSPDVRSSVRINRPVGMSLSYEDAAWVMLEAAFTDGWDRELVGASTPR